MYLRKCRDCGLEAHTQKDLNLFRSSLASKHGKENNCKICYNKELRESPDFHIQDKTRSARYKYNISLAEYEEQMATSDCCEICGSKDKLNYDHDHTTAKFRGVLCNTCNRGLGMLGDNKEGLRRAYEYLQKQSEP